MYVMHVLFYICYSYRLVEGSVAPPPWSRGAERQERQRGAQARAMQNVGVCIRMRVSVCVHIMCVCM